MYALLTEILEHLESSEKPLSNGSKGSKDEGGLITVASSENMASHRRMQVSKIHNYANQNTKYLEDLAMKLRFTRLSIVGQAPMVGVLCIVLVSDELFFQIVLTLR